MAVLEVQGGGLSLSVDAQSGRWLSLTGGSSDRSWLAAGDSNTGLPFVAATGLERGQTIQLLTERAEPNQLLGTSHRGQTELAISGNDLCLTAALTIPPRRGPRAGLCLDLDHLDREALPEDPHTRNITDPLMPVMVETATDLSWAWVAWQRNEGDLLLTVVDGPSAGWHIRYSYAGHRMMGFEILSQADDVIAEQWPLGRLPTSPELKVHIARVTSRRQAQERAAELLQLAMSIPASTTAMIGGTIPFEVTQQADAIELRKPSGEVMPFAELPQGITLDAEGLWSLRLRKGDRWHESTLLALADWQTLSDRVIQFHRDHYQLECGAFARALNGALRPEGRNFGADHFGNPDELQSCRVGEFGGFAAWAQLTYQERFGPNPQMAESIDAYFGWMFNRGREDDPRFNTLCFAPQEAHGRTYSPYHFYQEICYTQHEAWFIRQLADAIELGEGPIKEYETHLVGLVEHYLADHLEAETGIIWNQNWPDEKPVDYTTVDCCLVHLIRAAAVLAKDHGHLSEKLWPICRLMADHLYQRGFNFPTEGEPCTEDGSIACQAWGLATAFNQLPNPDPQWLQLAQDLMAYHAKLEMSGNDCRTNGSSIRFWETMYESEEWGPSINAGHGWTIWSAWARWEIFQATGSYDDLQQAWQHSCCVAAKIQPDGSIPPCYTPDPIPTIPHDDAWGDELKRYEARMTTAQAGMRFTAGRSMSSMHLFIFAPVVWATTCGFDLTTGVGVNARREAHRIIANGSGLDQFALKGTVTETLTIEGLADEVTVWFTTPNGVQQQQLTTEGGVLTLQPT